jgi:hypothetical protein
MVGLDPSSTDELKPKSNNRIWVLQSPCQEFSLARWFTQPTIEKLHENLVKYPRFSTPEIRA